jgi:ABC-type bacteriocin/lantibiotic exporter with double-glycine peptidase domain
VLTLIAQSAELAGVESHTLEWYLVWSTVALTVVTLTTTLVTALLSWVSWKQYKVEAEKSKVVSDNATSVANNSVDSMEHVAVVALTHRERVRAMKHLRKGSGV